VIYGWDPKCTMSQEWISTMRVQQLSSGAQQPFYNVLVQDGTCRYAAQGTDESSSRRTKSVYVLQKRDARMPF